MKSTSTPQSLLQQMAAIERMEPGKLCQLRRQKPGGPYYNLQRWEKGTNISEYVPSDQVPIVQENIEGYERFQDLVQEYVSVVSARSREQRIGEVKKKRLPPTTSSPRKPKSKPS